MQNEILDGLSKLLCLGLERTPASDMIDGTALAWCEALSNGRVWDRDLDAPRFRSAFVMLARTRTAWPAPIHFVDALPPRQQLALTKQPTPADPRRSAAAISEVLSMLGGKEFP